MTFDMQKVYDYIDQHADEYTEFLRTLVRQPSIADTGEGIQDMVKLVKKSLRGIGAQPQEVPTPGNPVIYAEIKGERDKTFGFYDHYDVQPVDPLNEWVTPPYSADVRDGAIYGRGVADNKNGLASKICAVDAFLKVYGKLPVNVKFIVEGEEEIGSPNLEVFAKAHPELLACDGYNWEGGVKEPGEPAQVHFGAKGLLYVELECQGPKTDSHSCYAPIVTNPAWRLVWALSTLKDKTDRVLIPGFYDKVRPLTQEEIDILKTDPYNTEAAKEYFGIGHFLNGKTRDEVLRGMYYEPTCNICGLVSGYIDPGQKTVLPAKASVKIDFRLVPDQDPQEIAAALRKHLDGNGFEDVQLKVTAAAPAFRSDPHSPFARAVVNALRGLYGEEPALHYSMDGTSPMHVFCKEQNIPAAMFGATSDRSLIHAPNEHLTISSYIEDIKIIAAVMNQMALED